MFNLGTNGDPLDQCPGFDCAPGWDAVTGLGTPNVGKILAALPHYLKKTVQKQTISNVADAVVDSGVSKIAGLVLPFDAMDAYVVAPLKSFFVSP